MKCPSPLQLICGWASSRSWSHVVPDFGGPPTKKICLWRKLDIAVCRRSKGRTFICDEDGSDICDKGGSDIEIPTCFSDGTIALPRLEVWPPAPICGRTF